MNNFIKSLMDEKNLKQKALAEILGISSSMISQWNDEATNIGIDSLYSMSKLFHVTVDELLDGKRSGESLEDKWRREFCINEKAAKRALIDGDRAIVIEYLNALHRADSRFFKLFEKKICGTITDEEIREWEYLRQFFNIKSHGYKLQDGQWLSEKDDIFDKTIFNTLISKYGKNNMPLIIWELSNIYLITRYDITVSEKFELELADEYYSDYSDIMGIDPLEDFKGDREIFYAIYKILSPIEKNNIITKAYFEHASISFLYELIKCGGNILYTREDFNMLNYDYKDLTDMEGDVRPALKIDSIHLLLWEAYGMDLELSYEQYQNLINRPRMEQIEMAVSYKEKSPVKYWEYIKSNFDILL